MGLQLDGDARLGDDSFPLEDVQAALCAQIDAEMARRQALDFTYAYPDGVDAIDDAGASTPAGTRTIQAAPDNMSDWNGLGSIVLAAIVAGDTTTVYPMRVQDNANVQTTAPQVADALKALGARQIALKLAAGPNKTRVRATTDVDSARAAFDAQAWP